MTNEEATKIIKNYDVYSCGYCHQGGDEVEEAFDMAIKALEQEQKMEWIPVSERLPEDDEDVLVQMTDYSMMVDFRTASSSGWFWAEKDDLPIAWMPLPEPYKAESEGKE